MHGELSGHPTLFLPGEDVVEAVSLGQGPMRIVVVSWSASKASIVVAHELGKVRIRFVGRADPPQPQLLDEPVLERLVRALDAALGRRRIGANHVDIEVAHRTAKLREAVAGFWALGIEAEHPGFVAVQRDRLAVPL